MPPSDVDLVNLSAAIYDATTRWDHFDPGFDDEICWSVRDYPDCQVVTFRGSIVLHDWYEDIRAFPVATRIGDVHQGFYADMEKMWGEFRVMVKKPVMITGHSLGAARADILAGLMLADGFMPARLTVFGEPKPGMPDFGRLISQIPGRSFRNGDANHVDLVTKVPLTIEPFDVFVHRKPLIDVSAIPTGGMIERDGLFSFHHIELYVAAVAAYCQQEKAA